MVKTDTGVFAALIGIGIVAIAFVMGGDNSAPTTRDEVVDSFRDWNPAPTSSGVDQGVTHDDGPGFAEQVVNRTGFLPSGFDAAGRVAQNNEQDFDDGSGGFVGL